MRVVHFWNSLKIKFLLNRQRKSKPERKSPNFFPEWTQFTSWARRCPCKKRMKHKPFFSSGHLWVQISCNKHNSIHCCNGICHLAFGRNAALVSPSRLCPLSSPLAPGKAACTALQETRSRNLPRWKTAHSVQEVKKCYFSTRSASQVGSLYVAGHLQQHHERQGDKGKK